MTVKQVYLIRHAQPDYPDGKMMCLGQKIDLPLSALGFEQAQLLKQYFAHLPIEAVYTSPLLRARQTAEAVAGSRPIHMLDDLIELSGGEWDGLTFDQLHARYPEYFGQNPLFSCPPGGENDESGLARMYAALAHIDKHTERCAAIVSHSGLIRTLLCDLLGRLPCEKKKVPQDCASFSLLEWRDGRWSVRRINVKPDPENLTILP